MEYLLGSGQTDIFNLGNGFFVKEIIDTARFVTGRSIPVIEGDRRPGDPPVLVGSNAKAQQILGWRPKYPLAKDILSHAWAWHQQRHGNGQL